MRFVEYFPIHSSLSADEAKQSRERTEVLCKDLTHLLGLSFSDFWNELLYNPSLRCSINSVLSRAPRYELDCVPDEAASSIKRLLTVLLAVFSRASSPEANEGMSTQTFGELLYENYVFDVTLMMDLCSIYYDFARPQLVAIFSNVFSHQEKYWEDVRSMMQTLPTVFDRVERELAKCPRQIGWFTDIIAYISDISWSLYTFLSVLSQLEITTEVKDINLEAHLPEMLAAFFEAVFVPLRSEILSDFQLTIEQRNDLLSRLSQASAHLVSAVRKGIIEPCLLDKIRNGSKPEKTPTHASDSTVALTQSFLQLMLQLLNYRKFSLAVHLLYPLDTDICFLRQAVGQEHIDDATAQYLLDAADCLLSETGLTRNGLEHLIAEDPVERKVTNKGPVEDPVPGPSISGLVREVREILPHMDVDLIQRCLVEFNDDTARVINAALEGSIPEHVLSPKQMTPKKSKTVRPSGSNQLDLDLATAAACGAVELRANQLWQGKREPDGAGTCLTKREKRFTIRAAVSVWDDDDEGQTQDIGADGETVRELTQEMNKLFVDEYEDEYDDTYDVHEGAIDDVESEEESTRDERTEDGAHASKYSDGRVENPSRQPVLRIENPEVVRERQQQYQQSRQAFRRGRVRVFQQPCNIAPQPMPAEEHFAFAPPRTEVSNRQVKDRGVSTTKHSSNHSSSGTVHNGESVNSTAMEHTKQEVSGDRHFRTAHKARFAAHNRRKLADRKRQL
ncbi:Activating signal cointegrator 1 complex subunit 2 [Clonorchis sinensis]|uniref:Activating signal cointegrator 1 complex subunit 2 n=1 Tax=Clonorchis sinensis TaxID=79923 RepID=A0A8T1M7F9_CLOSI|nr:Activating signal cointegrator 1 complex subunit 2 [Clonorchis sinensis]